MTDAVRFRLILDGMPVAWAEGPKAIAEIQHYAAVYSQDGPVKIEQRVNGKWYSWPRRTLLENSNAE